MKTKKQHKNSLNNIVYSYLREQLYDNIHFSAFYKIDNELYKLSIEDINDLVYYHIRDCNEET